MNVIATGLSGVVIIEPKVFGDERGFFLESFHQDRYKQAGINLSFVQDNHSRSQSGVLRGLHFQKSRPQGKLVRVVQGEVWDVAVDVNPTSLTYGQYEAVLLNAENKRQFYIPPGYAHGFVVTSETADFEYKCTDYYDPDDEGGIIWNDPDLNISWPVTDPVLSEKDRVLPTLKELNGGKI